MAENQQSGGEAHAVIKINGRYADVSLSKINDPVFDFDFNGEIMVQFESFKGVIKAVNAMDGYGRNIRESVIDKPVEVFYSTTPAPENKCLPDDYIKGWGGGGSKVL